VQAPSLDGVTFDGRYELGRMIGGGGMGHVYEAEHLGTGRRVAVKVISNPELAKDASIVGRFQREATAASAIDTPHICQVLDTGTDPDSGAPFMVMELMSGEDVQQLLQRVGPLPPELALRIGAQACMGLARAHEVNVVHRDVKPANLFLARQATGDIVVKLLDFGIAKVKMERAHDLANAELTRTGMLLGSPLYMSPEQALGTKNIDHRADLWSVGIVLYQLLTGRTPFVHATALGELIMAICAEPARHLQDLSPWVSPHVALVVHRALQIGADARYQTATEMFDAIMTFLPLGSAIQPSMLIALTEEERGRVAERAILPPNAPPKREAIIAPYAATTASVPPPGSVAASSQASSPSLSSSPSLPPPPRGPMPSSGEHAIYAPVSASAASSAAASSGAALATAALATAALATAVPATASRGSLLPPSLGGPALPPSLSGVPSQVAAPSSNRFVLIGAALGVIVVGGIAAFVALAVPVAPSTADSSRAVTEPPPAAAAPPSAAATAAEPASRERAVKLVVIAPDDATIELDGRVVRHKGGILEITGLLGSVHKVRVTSKDGEVEEDVVVTEIGAQPPKVTLVKGAKPRKPALPASPPKKPPTGIENKFE